MSNIYIFKRVEKKYFLTPKKQKELLNIIGDKLVFDKFAQSHINSLYLDTPNFLIIRNSINAVVYKEKLRIRSYGTPGLEDNVFFEIKKKYKGTVYKRRIYLPLKSALEYIETGSPPFDSQIMKEINYSMNFYNHPRPKMMISYDRLAYASPEHPNFRVTFDTNAKYRNFDLDLTLGPYGKPIKGASDLIMEIKTDGAMPLWMADALDRCQLFPIPFSKYKQAYLSTFCSENN